MKKKKKKLNSVIYILLIALAIVVVVRYLHIHDFVVVQKEELYVCGQPSGMDYARLAYKYHIATIVNIRPASEHRDQNWYNKEIVETKSLGIQYIQIPIEKNQFFPDTAAQAQFLAVMAERKNRPVLLHGGTDDSRVAMLVAVWLCKSQRYSSEQALEVVREIIDDRSLKEEEIHFVRQLETEKRP